MRLSEALKLVLGSEEVCVLDCSAELHEARRLTIEYLKTMENNDEAGSH